MATSIAFMNIDKNIYVSLFKNEKWTRDKSIGLAYVRPNEVSISWLLEISFTPVPSQKELSTIYTINKHHIYTYPNLNIGYMV